MCDISYKARSRRGLGAAAGFNLIELMLSLLIVAVLTAIAVPSYRSYVERAEIKMAMADIAAIDHKIARYLSKTLSYPLSLNDVGVTSLDPWGNAYVYLNISTVTGNWQLRKDRNLVPINTDYDLYSRGKDGASVAPLTAKKSHDDIVRANNGGYIGLAQDY